MDAASTRGTRIGSVIRRNKHRPGEGIETICEVQLIGRHHFCFQMLNTNRNDVMIIEDNFFPDSKEHPSTITLGEICERFTAAGLLCKSERQGADVKIFFNGRKSILIFTMNASGNLLTATMREESDYDADFACALFGVFDSIGWSYAPTED